METDVGSIVGYLRLDGAQFREEIAAAIAELRVLSGTDVNIDVKTDKLREVEADAGAAVRGLENVDREVQKVGNNGQRSTGLLLSSILLLGPALIPLGIGAVGLGAAFGVMGAAGLAAFLGIKNAMAQGNSVGVTYADGIHQIETAMTGLEAIGARNILGAFQSVVTNLMLKMPQLSQDMNVFSGIVGNTAAALINGVVNAFVVLAPYLQDAAAKIETLAVKFDQFSMGSGFATFAKYVDGILPSVIDFLGQLVTLVAHLVEALLPFGTGILSAVEVFIGALNSIPVNMLTMLAQLALSVFAGFKTWEAITGIVEAVVETLKGLNVTLEISEGVLKNLDLAATGIGVAIAVFTLLLAHNAEAAQQAKEKQEAYADALRASKGAIDDEVRSVAAKALEDEGALQTAQDLGISLSDITSATLGQKDALDRVLPALNAYIVGSNNATAVNAAGAPVQSELSRKATQLRDSITGQNEALNAQIRVQKAVNDASQVTSANMTVQEQQVESLAAKYGMSTATYQAAAKAQQDDAASLAATTAKMQMENDAAGLLKQTLDALNGKTITAAQAQQSFDSQLVNMGTHVNATGKHIVFTTTSIRDMSSASVALRGQLIQQVQSLESVIEAHGGLKNATSGSIAMMQQLRQRIIDNAVAHGIDRKAVTSYIDEIFKIPKSVPPTHLQVDDAAALGAINSFRAQLNSINGKTVTTYVRTVTSQVAAMNSGLGGVGGVGGQGMLRKYRGGIESFQHGGFRTVGFQSFANGKLPSQAMIAPDGANLVQWAERGTGDEAFIPLGAANRNQSVAIWEETGRRLGQQVGAGSMRGMEITGTLMTPFGPAQIKAVVKDELRTAAAQSRVAARQQNGVNRS